MAVIRTTIYLEDKDRRALYGGSALSLCLHSAGTERAPP